MARFATLIFATLCISSCTYGLTRVEFSLSARDLPDEDICCSPPVFPPDAYAIVYYAPSNVDSYIEEGRTRSLSNNNNPSWPELFAFNILDNSSTARVKVEIYDADVDDDDFMGYTEFKVTDVINAFGRILTQDLVAPKNQGQIIVSGRVNGTLFHVKPTVTRMNYKSSHSRV